jgi:cysteine desulfuration protein SufE
MSADPEFQAKVESCPPALQAIIAEFQEAEPRDRLEYLLEYAMDLPELPDRFQERRNDMEQVHECQTPVFLATELQNGHVHFFLEVPEESPTVRGYASILLAGFNDATPVAVLSTPEDVYLLLGLQDAISPQRLRGLHSLLVYMKRQVRNL